MNVPYQDDDGVVHYGNPEQDVNPGKIWPIITDYLKSCNLEIDVNVERGDYGWEITSRVWLISPAGKTILECAKNHYRDSFE